MRSIRTFILHHKILTWVLLLLAALILLLGNVVNSYYTRTQSLYDQEHERTTEIMEALLNLETGSRGYVITGKDEFLEPFRLGQSQLPRQVQEVQALILEGPRSGQQARLQLLEDIRDAGNDWINYAKNLQRTRRQSFEAAQSIVSSNAGKRRMDHIRLLMAGLQAQQQSLLQDAQQKSQSTLRWVQLFSLLGMLLAALSALLQG